MPRVVGGVLYYEEGERNQESRSSLSCSQKCPSPVFFGLLGLAVLLGSLMWFAYSKVWIVLFGLVTWAISLCLHEFAHAYTAFKGGDHAVVDKGYLTLNPLKYTTWLNSMVIPLIFLLIGGIGLPGGAVFINNAALRSRKWETAVALAGPAATFGCALLLCLPFMFQTMEFQLSLLERTDPHTEFWEGLAFCAFLQFSAFVLNMMPVPPLDGFGAVLPWASDSWKTWYRENMQAVSMGGLLIVFLLFWRVSVLFEAIVDLCALFGVPKQCILNGLWSFRVIQT